MSTATITLVHSVACHSGEREVGRWPDMHAGLPGHSFVLIDAQGMQRWYGEYPSMYLSSADLLDQIRTRVG